jgi:hypothetical protein
LWVTACTDSAPQRIESQAGVVLPASLGNWAATVAAPDTDWVAAFGSTELLSLVQEALTANPDIAIAQARIRAADARARSVSAVLLPQVDASASGIRQAGSTREGSAVETNRGAQISARYELDFWHRGRAARDEAQAQVRVARFDTEVVRISLQAAVVVAYIGLADLQQQQQSLKDQLALHQQTIAALQARESAGLANRAELAAQRAQLATAAAELAKLQQQHQDLLAALALLLGRSDAQLSLAGASLTELKQPSLVGTSPAQLLLRRPDVASAEAALAAANANVEAARAAFFPRVAIDLGLALQNPGFNAAVTTLQGTGLASSLAVSAIQPLFNGGKLQAEKELAVAQQQSLLASYRSSILAAMIDAQRAVAAANAYRQQLQQLDHIVTQLHAVVDVLQARYVAGLGDQIAMLDAQRAWQQAHAQQQQLQAQQLQAAVTVFRAFGGGWQVPQQGTP